MKAERKKIIAEYLRFMISGKEIKGRSWRNRPASKFYEYLRRDADLYKCSVMDVLYRDAEFVLNGVFIDLTKLDKTERKNQVENCTRVEYLSRPLVDGISYEIADNKIRIDSPHTNYINTTRHEKISLENILSMINEMDAIRKADKRIKVKGISTIRKRFKDAYKLYLIDWEVYNEAFNKCIVLAKQVEREGVHYGAIDDAVLNELTESRFVIDRLGHGGTNYSTMLELNNSVNSVLHACRMIGSDCLGIKIKF